jgi:RimJ/RimL family protein N-acetyltransferase
MEAGGDSPHNDASRRVFEKLGHARDDGPEARPFADEPGDVVMAIDRATFEHVNAAALAQLAIASIA